MKSLGFAIIGCGRIASKHADALTQKLKNAKLIAVCDVKKDRAEAFSKKYGVPFFTSAKEMLLALGAQIDVVNILTPSGNHAENLVELAQFKKHFVVEKPMALTLQDADRMIESCRQNGVRLFVVKQNRCNLPVQKLREALEQGRFGKLVMGSVRVRWCREQKYYDQDPWRGTWKLDGGVFANQASHHIDLLEWMLGEPVSVMAKSRTALVNIEVEDTGVAIIQFKNGAFGVVEATTATRPKDLEGSISILGEKGTVEIAGFAVNEMKTWNLADSPHESESVLKSFKELPPNVYGFGHVPYLQGVVDSLQNDTPSMVDGLEGRKSLELISAMYESIATGKEVKIGGDHPHNRLGRG